MLKHLKTKICPSHLLALILVSLHIAHECKWLCSPHFPSRCLAHKWESGKIIILLQIKNAQHNRLSQAYNISNLSKSMIYWYDITYFVVKYCILYWYFDSIYKCGVGLTCICRLQNLAWSGIFHFYLWYHFEKNKILHKLTW